MGWNGGAAWDIYFALCRQFVPKDKPALRFAARLAIVGSAVGLLNTITAKSAIRVPRESEVAGSGVSICQYAVFYGVNSFFGLHNTKAD